MQAALAAARRARASAGAQALADGLAAARQASTLAERHGSAGLPAWREARQLLLHFLQVSGDMDALLEEARVQEIACARQGDHEGRFTALRLVSFAGVETGRFGPAIQAAEAAWKLAEADPEGDRSRRSQALAALGWCFERMGDGWQADRLFASAVDEARAAAPERVLFSALNNRIAGRIGRYYLLRDAGDRQAAVDDLLEVLPLAREAQGLALMDAEPVARAVMGGNLGELLLHVGLIEEAEDRLEEARMIAEREGLGAHSRRIAVSRAEAWMARGSPQRAWDLLFGAIDFDDAAGGEPLTRMRGHRVMAAAAEALGRVDDALAHYKRFWMLERRRMAMQLQAQSELLVLRREADAARQELLAQRERAGQMEHAAMMDPLTGIPNRREADRRLCQAAARSARESRPLAVSMIDIDHFKQVNDRHGHSAGDEVLRRVCRLAEENLRSGDLLARIGGEEFLLLLPDTPAEAAREAVERVLRAIEGGDWASVAPGLRVTASAGLVAGVGLAPTEMIERSDAALYRAKAAGRNTLAIG